MIELKGLNSRIVARMCLTAINHYLQNPGLEAVKIGKDWFSDWDSLTEEEQDRIARDMFLTTYIEDSDFIVSASYFKDSNNVAYTKATLSNLSLKELGDMFIKIFKAFVEATELTPLTQEEKDTIKSINITQTVAEDKTLKQAINEAAISSLK